MFYNPDPLYLDVACTTPVLKVAVDTHNKFAGTCLGRSDYPLAVEANELDKEARLLIKQWFGIEKVDDWQVVFDYNTTNLINKFRQSFEPNCKIFSSIGHNSVSLQECFIGDKDWKWPNNIATAYSNIDGNRIHTEVSVCDYSIIDLAQGFFSSEIKAYKEHIYIFSAHKVYSTHLGVALIHKDVINDIEPTFIGGGTIYDSDGTTKYTFYDGDERYKAFECGLPDTGAICALGAAIKHLMQIDAKELYKNLSYKAAEIKNLLIDKGYKIATCNPNKYSTIISFFDPKDHTAIIQIAKRLSQAGIACRSGSCCAESWLIHNKFPQVVRLSLGLNYTKHDKVMQILNKIL